MVQSFSELTFFPCPNVLKKLSQAVAAPQRGTGGGLVPPKFQNFAKIDKKKWHKISWVYLWNEKLCQNPPPPPTSFRFLRAGATTVLKYIICENS